MDITDGRGTERRPRRRVHRPVCVALLGLGLLGLWPPAALAAPGDLDASFGASGIARTHIGATDSLDRPDAMVLDSSGRMIVAGSTSTPIGDSELVIARYHSDGSLDASFGTGGIIKSNAGSPHAVTLDAAGRIVVAGQLDGPSGTDVMVARFLATGSPDTSFGGNDGVVVTDFTGNFDSAEAVAIDGSGRIVIGGGAPHVLVARYLENGDLDTSFGGGDGYFVETMNDPTTGFLFMGLEDIALDAAGRIVGVGGGFVAMRFLSSGTLDSSFGGGDGMVGHRVENRDKATAVTIDSAGRILVAGSTGSSFAETASAFDVGVVRYSEAGTLDTGFGDGDGMAVAPDVGGYESAQGIAVDSNGRIITGGATYDGSITDFFVARFLPFGRISGSFGGGDGIVTTDLGGDEFGMAVALDSSGRIVLSGSVDNEEPSGDTFADFALIRYEGGPAVDVFHDLSVQTAGKGSGTVAGLGIDCGSGCTATYDAGTIVTLTAIPDHDELGEVESVFTGWSGDCAGEAETCQVTMDAAKEVTATFAPLIEEPPAEEPPPEEEPPSEEPPANPPASPPVPAPLPGGSDPLGASVEPKVGLAAAAGVAPIKGGKAFVRLRCSGQTACRGVAKLVARVQLKRNARRSAARTTNVVLGQSRFQIPPGKAKLLRIRLNRKGRQLLRRAGRRGLQAQLVGRGLKSRAVRLKPRQNYGRRSGSKPMETARIRYG